VGDGDDIERELTGVTGRGELTRVLGGRRFVTPADVAAELSVDSTAATQRLARRARGGWVRRVRRGLYIGVPVDASNPGAWSDEALVIAARVWDPCYFRAGRRHGIGL
jgi:predicted transcriptional regulator of viral defense system